MTKKYKNIQVAVRMRPLLDKYQDHEAWIANSQHQTISSIPKKLVTSNEQSSLNVKRRQSKVIQKTNFYEFSYDHVFSQNQNNAQVYSESCKKIVQQFLKGKNASIFMYGQTTSGKTYTMLGRGDQQGLIIHSLKDIFKHFQKNDKRKHSIFISYMEIYNQQINDLLNPEGLNLRIVDDNPQNLSEFAISSYSEAFQLLEEGQKLRSYAQKNFHDHSSRSHTIFQIKLIQSDVDTGKMTSKNVLNLVDLAGSERVGDQDSTQETGYINKSLFVLSNVVHKLSQKKRQLKIIIQRSCTIQGLQTHQSAFFITNYKQPYCIHMYDKPCVDKFQSDFINFEICKPIKKSESFILNESSFVIQQKEINKLKQENVSLRKNLSQKEKSLSEKAPVSVLQQAMQSIECYIGQMNKQNFSMNLHYRRRSTGLAGQNSQTIEKLQTLYNEYKKNVQTLEKEYMRAMVNMVSSELRVDKNEVRQTINRAVGNQIL